MDAKKPTVGATVKYENILLTVDNWVAVRRHPTHPPTTHDLL